jgi:hypothetical protein
LDARIGREGLDRSEAYICFEARRFGGILSVMILEGGGGI